MKKTMAMLLATACAVMTATAQEKQESPAKPTCNISGYVQGQFQWGEKDASMKVGAPNENPEKSFNRFGIRRGRIKFASEYGIGSAVFQLDITEKGVGFKDAYLSVKDPWIHSLSLKAGIFDRPFGYEISYSSSKRESPERSTIFQTLFPDERDLGAMLTLQAPKSSKWSLLKLEAGLFAGNGIKSDTDSKKDFIGHLSAAKAWGRFSVGGGVSYYNGKVYQEPSKFVKREYFGIDLQLALKSAIGTTNLNAEYLFGQQPGTETGSKSPNTSTLPEGYTFVRDFSGGYAMLVQSLGKLPVSVVAKYDWYDPNTKETVNKGDLSQRTIGVGALWNINSALRLTAYYDINHNEGTDRKDNLFTLRLQYKF